MVPQVNGEDVIFLSLDIETSSQDASLAAYADENEFPWLFAVATPDVISALVQEFGQAVTISPSQPHFIIRPDGSTTGLMTGNPSPDEVLQMLQNAAGSA